MSVERFNVDDTDGSITYEGDWYVDPNRAWVRSTWQWGARATIHFRGTYIAVFGVIPDGWNNEQTQVEFQLDGGPIKSESRFSRPEIVWERLWYQSGPLDMGRHTLTMTYRGVDRNFEFDRYEYEVAERPRTVTPPAPAPPPETTSTSTPTSTRTSTTPPSTQAAPPTQSSAPVNAPRTSQSTRLTPSDSVTPPQPPSSSAGVSTVISGTVHQLVTTTHYINGTASIAVVPTIGSDVDGAGSTGSSSKVPIPVGALVGAVVGGVVFLLVLLILLVFCVRRRRRVNGAVKISKPSDAFGGESQGGHIAPFDTYHHIGSTDRHFQDSEYPGHHPAIAVKLPPHGMPDASTLPEYSAAVYGNHIASGTQTRTLSEKSSVAMSYVSGDSRRNSDASATPAMDSATQIEANDRSRLTLLPPPSYRYL